MKKVITRLRGGIGNQLFCYAAGRRLALVNDAELVIDADSGFRYDLRYRRRYSLDRFAFEARMATPSERLDPFARLRRRILMTADRLRPFESRRYFRERGVGFDPRMLDVRVRGSVWLDGYWQSENYFSDVADIIRKDLSVIPPEDSANLEMAEQIRKCRSVCLHVRWFDAPGSGEGHNICKSYYEKAVARVEAMYPDCRYFIFSDRPEAASLIDIPRERVTFVNHNKAPETHYADLWLMTQCSAFIIANSTFSWWAAWLRRDLSSPVFCPDVRIRGLTEWGFEGLLPPEWAKIKLRCGAEMIN